MSKEGDEKEQLSEKLLLQYHQTDGFERLIAMEVSFRMNLILQNFHFGKTG